MKKTFKISVLSFFVIALLFTLNINTISVMAINVNEELHDETRIASYNNDLPAITILTHGQRGEASHWSSYMGGFVYDSNSLVEKIRSLHNADVYLAEMSSGNSHDAISNKNFDLKKCTKDTLIVDTSYYKYKFETVNKIVDYSKHIVIVFDSYYNDESHDIVYSELESVIDKISLDYYNVVGTLPKLNLIGHSRGGLINLIYATNHPYNVDSLISIGTPYEGSALSNAFSELVRALGLGAELDCPSGEDILSIEKQNELRNNWNNMLISNPNAKIKAIAIGNCTSSDFLAELFAGGYVNQELYDFLGIDENNISLIEKLRYFLIQYSAIGITEFINSNPDVVHGIFKCINFGIDVTNFFSNDTTTEEREKIQVVLDNFVLEYGLLVFNDDFFIDYKSQTAENYEGFRTHKKIYFSDNTNYLKTSVRSVPIPHNLETRDEETISFILSELSFGSLVDNLGNINQDQENNISYRSKSVKYQFTPSKNTLYKFNFPNNNVKIVVFDKDTNEYSILSPSDNIKLNSGKSYDIYINNKGKGYSGLFEITFLLLDDIMNTPYTMDSYESLYLEINFNSATIYSFNPNNPYINQYIYNSSYSVLFYGIETSTYRYEKNTKYYIRLYNNSPSFQNLYLEERDVENIIYAQPVSTYINTYYKYYMFEAPNTRTYILDLSSTLTSYYSPNIQLYNERNELLSSMSTISTYDKNLYSIPLNQGDIIYIGIKNNYGYSRAITLDISESSYYWVVNNIIENDRSINMVRGNQSVKVSYYCNGYRLKGNIFVPSDSSQYISTNAINENYEYSIFINNNAPLSYDSHQYLSIIYSACLGEPAYETQELKILVKPYIDISLSDTTDIYDYKVIINIGSGSILANESVIVRLKITNKNNNSIYQDFVQNSFNSAEIISPSIYYNVGNLNVSIHSVTYLKSGCSLTYLVSNYPECYDIGNDNITKKGYIQNGEGTSSSPYLITSQRELNNIRKMGEYSFYDESYYINGYFKLMSNITMSGSWIPIEPTFRGNFNGNFKTINNLQMTINNNLSSYGLFSSTKGAIISNLYLSNFYVYSGTNTSSISIGAISGFSSYDTITGCTVLSGSIANNYNNASSFIGGIIGLGLYSNLQSCETGSSLSIYGYGNIGGIAGISNGSTFNSCINRSNLYYKWNGSFNGTTGGIVGKATVSTSITNCKNYGLIKFNGAQSDSKDLAPYMGQVVGYKDSSSSFTNSIISGTTNYGNLRKVGGFLGIGRTDQARYASTTECGYSE